MANTVTISYTFGQILANVDASTITVSFLSGKDALKIHSGLTLDDGTNPHGTTKSDVGLGNTDNTSDANKPISTATQTALDNKVTSVVAGANITVDNTDPKNPIVTAAVDFSNSTIGTTSTADKIWVGTQAEYDAIATKDATTIYNII